MATSEYCNVIISFIIPAFNEEECIVDTIRAIKQYASDYTYEIIIVDNGSVDGTAVLVKSENVRLIHLPIGTIAAARNEGARVSKGQILVFLDADVLLTPQWQSAFRSTLELLLEKQMLVTGSRCNVANESNWLSRYWYSRMLKERPNYINSGHLIATRKFFNEVGGFNSELKTSEDYDFCLRAKKVGAEIINNPELNAIHTGYPTKLKDFVARERWHGYEDFKSLQKIFNSNIAVISIVNIILMLFFFVAACLKANILYILLYFVLMYIISGISSLLKFGVSPPHFLLFTSIIFFSYYFGRSLAFIDALRCLVKAKK